MFLQRVLSIRSFFLFRKRKEEPRTAAAVIFNKSINRHWFSVYMLYALNSLKCDV